MGELELSRYPHLFPPPGFSQFHRNGLLTIPAVAATTQLASVLISSNQEGWLRKIGLEAGDWDIISMSILIGTQPIRDYVKITVPLGSPTTPVDVFVNIPVNIPLILTATSTGAAPIPVRWTLWGWFYSKESSRS